MKEKMKLLSPLFLLLTLIMNVSCEKEMYGEATRKQINRDDFIIKRKSFDQLNEEPKFNSAYKKINSEIQTKKLSSKTVMEEMYNFTIDSTQINEVLTEKYTSYSFGIIRDSINPNFYENLFIEIDSTDAPQASILKYNINPITKEIISISAKLIQYNVSVTGKILYDGPPCDYVTVTTETQCACVGHWPGQSCSCSQGPTSSTQTYLVCRDDDGGTSGDTWTNTSSESGGGGSGGNSVSAPRVLTPKEQRIKSFNLQLTPVQKECLNSLDENTRGKLMNFLESNTDINGLLNTSYSAEDIQFAGELIDYCIENNNSQESIDEVNNILDLIDDGKINGEEVVVGPDTPITNMADYLSCFNLSQGATITIYADQPKRGKHDLFSVSNSVGHAFISIKQGNNIATLGFYPQSSVGSIVPNNLTPNPTDFFSTPGVFGNDQGHTYDVSLTVPINSSGLTNLINGFISIAENNPVYNLGSLNCTDIALMAFESNTNINIPSCESPFSFWNGQTPGTLGEVIRSMPTPVGGIKNTTGGNASNNNCN